PLYLSIIGLLATGGHVEACAFSAFILLSISLLVFRPSINSVALACLIGIIAGLAWWSSLLSAPFLLAGVLGLTIARPRLLLGRIPWMGLAGFLIGSSPFWLWELLHDFSTFGFFEGHGVGIFKQLWSGLYMVLRFSFFQSFLGDWWDGHSVLPSVPSFLAWTVFILIYLPAFFLSLLIIFQWFRRIVSLRNPFEGPKDLVVVTFWILILAFSTSEQGANGSLRYSLSLYVPFTILLALWLGKVFRFRMTLGVATLIGLLGFNLFLHHLFLDEFKNLPLRPVDKLITALKNRGIRYAYADNRISQVLTFESGEKIICADYYGQRNFNYLRAVDAAPAKEVAIVTHQKLGNPYPETMAAALRLLGGSFKRVEVGDDVFWCDFKEPTENLRSLPPQDWRITASQGHGQVGLIKDRDILTGWKILKKAADFLAVDLGQPKRLARISLLPGPIGFGLPSGFKLETSLDQKKWEKIAELSTNDMLTGLYWYRGRPRLDQNPRLQITFPPRSARFIRITNLTTPENPQEPWTIAELFIYEVSPLPVKPSEKAVKAYNQANRALDHWMDDPTGPHPLFPGVNLDVRRKQVNWQTVIQSLQQAIQEAPNWEDAHQLFGEAVDWGRLWNIGGKQNKKKTLNYSTPFPQEKLTPISPTHFRVSSNANNTAAGLAIDGDPFTRWGSSRGQEPGMFFQVDLGANYLVNGFSLFFGSSINDYPRNLKIMGSPDGKHWQDIQTTSRTYYAFAENQIYKKTDYFFSPIKIRILKLIQEGKDPDYWWSIYEAEVFGEKG
ncbi:MAG: discoidin domain-containing protein, partial [Thermodesulfobacteriota bacterium]